jgi:hypothetical protein
MPKNKKDTTQEILKRIKELVSKKDFKQFKEEVKEEFVRVRKEMATKEELAHLRKEMEIEFAQVRKEMATKEELNKLEQMVRNVESELIIVKQAVLETREAMVTKSEWQELMIKIDKLFSIVEKLVKEKVVTDAQIERIEKDVAVLKEKVGL